MFGIAKFFSVAGITLNPTGLLSKNPVIPENISFVAKKRGTLFLKAVASPLSQILR
jgi:hypothetical protein